MKLISNVIDYSLSYKFFIFPFLLLFFVKQLLFIYIYVLFLVENRFYFYFFLCGGGTAAWNYVALESVLCDSVKLMNCIKRGKLFSSLFVHCRYKIVSWNITGDIDFAFLNKIIF